MIRGSAERQLPSHPVAHHLRGDGVVRGALPAAHARPLVERPERTARSPRRTRRERVRTRPLRLCGCHLPCDRPDEAGQLTRDGGGHLRFRFAAGHQAWEPRGEAQLGLPRNIPHHLRQLFLARERLASGARNPLIRPRGFGDLPRSTIRAAVTVSSARVRGAEGCCASRAAGWDHETRRPAPDAALPLRRTYSKVGMTCLPAGRHPHGAGAAGASGRQDDDLSARHEPWGPGVKSPLDRL